MQRKWCTPLVPGPLVLGGYSLRKSVVRGGSALMGLLLGLGDHVIGLLLQPLLDRIHVFGEDRHHVLYRLRHHGGHLSH